jgi:uncharacterized membrane protein YqjE
LGDLAELVGEVEDFLRLAGVELVEEEEERVRAGLLGGKVCRAPPLF